MSIQLPTVLELGIEEQPSYDDWFRAQVLAAINDPRPTIPHDEVMAEMHELLCGASGRAITPGTGE